MRVAAEQGAGLVVYPELALTSFFPRWWIEDEGELDAFYETSMPSEATAPLFEAARSLGVGFSLGFAELLGAGGRKRRFNTSVLVGADGAEIGRYRKIHLPGDATPDPALPFQHLEKRYFETGDLGFPVWRAFGGIVGMAICNDRRWSETYRVMALQGAELIVLGYNTPLHNPEAPAHDALGAFHNQLVMQAGAYQNGCWVVGVAKCGNEEGVEQLGNSMIVAPSGEVVAQAKTLQDELVFATCDFARCDSYKQTIFDFAAHREPAAYRLITERKGAIPPP